MSTATQQNRQLSISTPLGDDRLLLVGFTGREELSRLFQYDLELVSEDTSIRPADIVGKNVTFQVRRESGQPRFFNGFVRTFSAGAMSRASHFRRYRAQVVPWLWFLTRTADCRIFQFKKAPDIIIQIFQDLGFSDFEDSGLTKSYPQRTYCVQYRETDFNFVSRLMEEEGIFYAFRHQNGKHTLVMADATSAYRAGPDATLRYERAELVRAREEWITQWERRYEYQTGKWAHTDYNFEKPGMNLMSTEQTVLKLVNNANFEVYDYPGHYGQTDEGRRLVRIRMEEEETAYDVVQGESLYRALTPGEKFKLQGFEVAEENGQGYVLTSVEHEAIEPSEYESVPGGGSNGLDPERFYRNRFTCIPDSVVFRPQRISRKPVIEGPQTAVVVGPAGEEIYPDEYGRVKVQFHWDREGKRDENSSCWMRVSQIHAGQGWGYMDIPRIGEEVIVDFLEGDPDQPIITGRVYNGDNMPPFALPDGKTRRGNTTKTYQGSGFNEMSMDDTPGAEQIRIHAQYNMDSVVENDETHTVHNNRTKAVDIDEAMTIGNNQTLDVGVNRSVQVGVNHSETVGANQSITVGANQSTSVGSNQTNSVGIAKNEMIGAVSNEMVGAAKATTVGAGYALSVGFAMNIAVGFYSFEQVGFDKSILVGGELKIDVGSKVRIECGSSSLTMDAGGNIVLEGVQIHVKGSGPVKIEGAKIDLN
jgi:type VI secretion system secreted protein VgrG